MNSTQMQGKNYLRLGLMAAASFVSMYLLMYAMVDEWRNVHPGLNQTYMAGLMTAAMVLIELALMRPMYRHRIANVALAGATVLALLLLWLAIRSQAAIGDRQFLRSMIPHHAGAVLMCTRAPIHDPEIQALCRRIIKSQREEIVQMTELLDRR